MSKEGVDFVSCKVCGRRYKKLTSSHLTTHNISKEDYLIKYPDALLLSGSYKGALSIKGKGKKSVLKGKTHEEIYGKDKAQQLIKSKSEKLIKYSLEERLCKVCHKVFTVVSNSKQVYCSVKCQHVGLMKEKKRIKCKECGNTFYDYPSSTVQFCSDRCVSAYRIKSNTVETCCRHCGKVMEGTIGRVRNGRFCSKECRRSYRMHHKGYRNKVLSMHGEICSRCNSVDNIVVHHKDGNQLNDDIRNLVVLCKSCHFTLHSQIAELEHRFTGQPKIEQGVVLILQGLRDAFGLDIINNNFKDTPKRVARAYYEIFTGINSSLTVSELLRGSFPSHYTGMVIGEGIHCFSMCPHHLLPVEYVVNVGYIPNNKTVGISKLSRVVELLAKQPELQETFTENIACSLDEGLKPKGVIVQVRGRHLCMAMRGVNQRTSWTLTSSIKGLFEEQKVREEFMLLLKGNKIAV